MNGIVSVAGNTPRAPFNDIERLSSECQQNADNKSLVVWQQARRLAGLIFCERFHIIGAAYCRDATSGRGESTRAMSIRSYFISETCNTCQLRSAQHGAGDGAQRLQLIAQVRSLGEQAAQ
jgi:hypothetical protein